MESLWCKPQGMSILQPVCQDQFVIVCLSGGLDLLRSNLILFV